MKGIGVSVTKSAGRPRRLAGSTSARTRSEVLFEFGVEIGIGALEIAIDIVGLDDADDALERLLIGIGIDLRLAGAKRLR